MEGLLLQAPIGLTKEFINEIYNKNNNDVAKTLMELWEIPEEKQKVQTEKQKNWNEIRQTCDAYDSELSRLISNVKNSNINKEKINNE
jgi:hypothetical protein